MKRDWDKIKTCGQVMNEAIRIMKTGDREEGKKFLDEYRAITPSADENIGYMTGYYDNETMVGLQEFFDLSHPIFGRSIPTPREAFDAGVKMGKKSNP